MCGRISLVSTSAALSRYFGLTALPPWAPRYNLAPGQQILAVRLTESASNEVVMLNWGLLPGWTKDKDKAYKMINARAETVTEKPAFRAALKARRCLIPASGFYEWRQSKSGKQPFHIRKKDRGLIAFAGIWESWIDKQAQTTIQSCAIITTAANALLRPVHHRMPVIIPEDKLSVWLHSGDENSADLFSPHEWPDFEAYPVSSYVNNARNDGPECLQLLN